MVKNLQNKAAKIHLYNKFIGWISSFYLPITVRSVTRLTFPAIFSATQVYSPESETFKLLMLTVFPRSLNNWPSFNHFNLGLGKPEALQNKYKSFPFTVVTLEPASTDKDWFVITYRFRAAEYIFGGTGSETKSENKLVKGRAVMVEYRFLFSTTLLSECLLGMDNVLKDLLENQLQNKYFFVSRRTKFLSKVIHDVAFISFCCNFLFAKKVSQFNPLTTN